MPWLADKHVEKTRACFSMSPVVKRLYPGAPYRESLCMNLATYYQDALFATPEEPVEVELDGETFQLFPTNKDARKIRVQVKS